MKKKTKVGLTSLMTSILVPAVVAPTVISALPRDDAKDNLNISKLNVTSSHDATASTANPNIIDLGIPNHEDIKIGYNPFLGYQVIATQSEFNLVKITDKNYNAKENWFLLNGDIAVLIENVSGTTPSTQKFPISGLYNFTFIPASLQSLPKTFNQSAFNDPLLTYIFANGVQNNVSYNTVQIASRVVGYTVTPLISKFAYVK